MGSEFKAPLNALYVVVFLLLFLATMLPAWLAWMKVLA